MRPNRNPIPNHPTREQLAYQTWTYSIDFVGIVLGNTVRCIFQIARKSVSITLTSLEVVIEMVETIVNIGRLFAYVECQAESFVVPKIGSSFDTSGAAAWICAFHSEVCIYHIRNWVIAPHGYPSLIVSMVCW